MNEEGRTAEMAGGREGGVEERGGRSALAGIKKGKTRYVFRKEGGRERGREGGRERKEKKGRV